MRVFKLMSSGFYGGPVAPTHSTNSLQQPGVLRLSHRALFISQPDSYQEPWLTCIEALWPSWPSEHISRAGGHFTDNDTIDIENLSTEFAWTKGKKLLSFLSVLVANHKYNSYEKARFY